ncbi:hypothetical protein E1A91_A01G081600v1 [Gossypium mustelinum]|uniref:Cupin type-1 domain-containing protein n=1 Tax=Gossypium mustelinum TaxID=34275 RepID=A0A5D3AAR8_GOSMU|nr:hypothetical protein E1A91_A01G081600v1 [Gossypium mustelinum]
MALTIKQQFFLAILDGNFFTYTGMRPLIASDPPTNFTVTKATMAEFPVLNGQTGDIFVFLKRLVHYQFNCAENDSAIAVSAFDSSAAGTVSVPSTVLATGTDDNILAKSFKTEVYTIQKLKAGFALKA